MARQQPYKDWTRRKLFRSFRDQSFEYGFNIYEIRQTVFDPRWNPCEDYDGCTLVQDPIHPFYPCFRHDYERIVLDRSGDKDFKGNLLQYGMKKFKANLWFVVVRLHWILYARWK